MRLIGLVETDSSPLTREEKGWGARIPEMMRVVVPLLPV